MQHLKDEANLNFRVLFISVFLIAITFTYLLQQAPSAILPFCGVISFAFCLLRPEWSYFYGLLFIFISSSFFLVNANEKMMFEFLDLLILCSFFSWILGGLAKARKSYATTDIDFIIFIFFAWTATSLIWTANKNQGLFEIYKLFASIAQYLLTKSLLHDRKMLKKVIVFLTIIAGCEAVISLISVWIDQGYDWSQFVASNIEFTSRFWAKKTWPTDGGRGTGTAVAHTMGALLNMVLFPAVGYFFVAKGIREKRIWGISIIIITLGMASTLTKSSLGSYLIGALFIIIHIRKLRGKLFTSFVLLLIFFVVTMGLSRIRDVEKSINFTTHQMDSSDSETSMGTRLEWWGEGFVTLVRTEGLGYGVGGFRFAVDNVVPDGSHQAVLFDLGLFGFTLYVFIFAHSFLVFYGHLKTCAEEDCRKIMLPYLAGYLAMMLSWTVTLYYTYSYMWFYLGLGYAIMHVFHTDDHQRRLAPRPTQNSFVAMLTDHVG